MSTLNTLFAQFATTRAKPSFVRENDPRKTLIEAAQKQIAAIQSGEVKGTWFTVENGQYIVTLRNGRSVLFIQEGQGQYVCPNADAAVGLLQAVQTAARSGDLDSLLAATAKKRS